MDIDKLVDLILFSDTDETPLSVLGDHYHPNENMRFDVEQQVRLGIAATLKNMSDLGELKIN